MKQVPITNTGTANLHIAGAVIRPGSTRMVDASLVPPDLLPEESEPAETPEEPDAIAELLKGSVPEIGKALPALSDEDLDRADELEQASRARKGVLDAIAHERVRRAAANEGAGTGEGSTSAGEGNA